MLHFLGHIHPFFVSFGKRIPIFETLGRRQQNDCLDFRGAHFRCRMRAVYFLLTMQRDTSDTLSHIFRQPWRPRFTC